MATLNVRLDDKLKNEAYEALAELEVSPSDLMRSVFQYVAQNRRIPVQVTQVDTDNREATLKIWAAYEEARNLILELVETLRTESVIKVSGIAELFSKVDLLIRVSNDVVDSLVQAKEWSELCSQIQKIVYKLKYTALSSRQGPEFVMYSSEAVREFSHEFYRFDLDIHDLMLHSRYL